MMLGLDDEAGLLDRVRAFVLNEYQLCGGGRCLDCADCAQTIAFGEDFESLIPEECGGLSVNWMGNLTPPPRCFENEDIELMITSSIKMAPRCETCNAVADAVWCSRALFQAIAKMTPEGLGYPRHSFKVVTSQRSRAKRTGVCYAFAVYVRLY
jgi:hypothetical protein